MNSVKAQTIHKQLWDQTNYRITTVPSQTKLVSKQGLLKSWKSLDTDLTFLEGIAIALVDWLDDDESALTITQFLVLKRILPTQWKRWLEASEDLRNAREFAMMVIGNRREIGALTFRLNANMMIQSMPMYDDDWKELTVWRAGLKNMGKEESRGSVRVMVEEIPSSPSAPGKR